MAKNKLIKDCDELQKWINNIIQDSGILNLPHKLADEEEDYVLDVDRILDDLFLDDKNTKAVQPHHRHYERKRELLEYLGFFFFWCVIIYLMFKFVAFNFKKGIEKIVNNPQLIYTIVVAVLITGSFIFMSERFISIANDAGERLINVRIGSLQDAFVTFAGDKIDDPDYLNGKIREIVAKNETIKSFRVMVREVTVESDSEVGENSYVILASDKTEEIGKFDYQSSFLYSLAVSDPSNSMTVAASNDGERLFKTSRAIIDRNGNVVGVAMTTQTLSLADAAIQGSIRNTQMLLFAVILLVMILFLRHSRIIDYMDLYKKLKEVDQMKDDFVSMASHELRTPLTVIRGYAEILREAPGLSDETKTYATRIDASTKELDSLVADILDVSRIEQGRMSFEMKKINPGKLIEENVSALAVPAAEKGIKISFDNSKVADGQYINADEGRLKQILVNIIGNAIKYTVKGEVVVRQYDEKGFLYIRVSDTGIGMTEDERTKLFEKFYRVKNEETANIRGTGLGLWITGRMIKEMKGKISVESIKGVGSHFIISFPIVK